MTYEKSVFYTRGSLSSGAVSVSLNDSWTGRQLLQTLGSFPPNRLSPEGVDVSVFFFFIFYNVQFLQNDTTLLLALCSILKLGK